MSGPPFYPEERRAGWPALNVAQALLPVRIRLFLRVRSAGLSRAKPRGILPASRLPWERQSPDWRFRPLCPWSSSRSGLKRGICCCAFSSLLLSGPPCFEPIRNFEVADCRWFSSNSNRGSAIRTPRPTHLSPSRLVLSSHKKAILSQSNPRFQGLVPRQNRHASLFAGDFPGNANLS